MKIDREATRGPRVVSIAMLALVGLAAGLLTACSSTHQPHESRATGHPAAAAKTTGPTSGAKAAALHDTMRELWEQHVAWTRLAIVDFASGSNGFDATAARLMQNQVDIGNAIKPYYGAAAGTELTSLLHDHIAIAVLVLQAAKSGHTMAFNAANHRWYANADSIADFLAKANPQHWPQDMMRQMMKVHLNQTLTEASDELTGKYAASAAEYDRIETHIIEMADGLSEGIVAAFPDKF